MHEANTTPLFRHVHVNDSLRRPNPVVFSYIRELSISAFDNFVPPLDARKVYLPLIAGIRRRRLVRKLTECFPWKRYFDTPAVITIPRIVESPPDVYGSAQARNLPFIARFASPLVRLVEEQVPAGVERVDFKFVVLERIAVRIDKDLEIVVVENYRI